MTRTILDKELEELDQQIQQLGCLVEGALSKALKALETDDLAVVSMVTESDVTIDSLRTGIEEHAMRLLILQQPLGGRDLRYLTSALLIVGSQNLIAPHQVYLVIVLALSLEPGSALPTWRRCG